MKAEDFTLQDLMILPHEMGGGFLNEHRMIISSAVAWGMLSRDLITALGVERAKRFLMRYGWHCGQHEAEVFKNLFPWENDLDWIFAGQRMHSLSGRVRSVTISSSIDRSMGTFNVEGYWYDSYEAMQFLDNFPFHHEPVCYFLAGYASGYNSMIMGQEILFKEIECIGKGDAHCKYVGKTIAEWADGESIMNYEQAELANELDQAYKKIEKQREIEKRVSQISQNLTKIILQGRGYEALVKTLGESLSCGVLIETQHFQPVAAYGEAPLVTLRGWMEQTKGLNRSHPHAGKIKLLNERNTVEFEVGEHGAALQRRLVTPIMLRNQPYGYISLINHTNRFGDLELVLLERASNACAILVFNEQTILETEQRLKGQLLDELLTAPFQDSFDSKRYSYLGYDIHQPHYVVIIKLDHKPAAAVDHGLLNGVIHKTKDHITAQLKGAELQVLISTRLDQVSVLIPESFITKGKMNLKQYGQQLLSNLEPLAASLYVRIGISSLCVNVDKIHYGYKEAVKSLEVASMKRNKSLVVLASELGYLSVMLDARKPEELERFAYNRLGALEKYDQNHDTELLKTVYYYLENECNLYQTARKLNISNSGMRYRLQRIKDMFDIDFGVPSVRFNLQLAFEIYLVLGKWKL